MNNTKKICIDCKKLLLVGDFYPITQAKKTYYSSRCKKCDIQSYRTRMGGTYQKRAITLFSNIKSRCKKKPSLKFTITKDDIISQYERQGGKCYYSGTQMSSEFNDPHVISVDRKNSSLGYTTDNIVLCCWKINRMKSDLTESEFISLCKDIFQFSTNQVLNHP